MFRLRSVTSTTSPTVAVSSGPGTCALNAHAATSRPPAFTVAVPAVSVNRLVGSAAIRAAAGNP